MKKRGFLLASETLKIVVAVICIGFLVYFLTSLYFSNLTNEKFKEAESLLISSEESIKMKIGGLENMNSTERHLVNPRGWYLFGFVEEEKPNSCAGENCLCICGNALIQLFNGQIKKCDKEGICLIVSNLKKEKIKIKIKEQFILIKNVNNEIEISEIK